MENTKPNKGKCSGCLSQLTPAVEKDICSNHPEGGEVLWEHIQRGEGHSDTCCDNFVPAPEYMTTHEAIKHAEVFFRLSPTVPTIIKWCKERGIGRQFGGKVKTRAWGRWRVYDLKKFKEILNAED